MARSIQRVESDRHRPMKREHCHTAETRRAPLQPLHPATWPHAPRLSRSKPKPWPDQNRRAQAESRFRQRQLRRSETGRYAGQTVPLPIHGSYRLGNAVQPKGLYPVSSSPVKHAQTKPNDQGWTTNRLAHPKNSLPNHRPDQAQRQRAWPTCAAADMNPPPAAPAQTCLDALARWPEQFQPQAAGEF